MLAPALKPKTLHAVALAAALLCALALPGAGSAWARNSGGHAVALSDGLRLVKEKRRLLLQDARGQRLAELALRGQHLGHRPTPSGVLATLMDADTQQVWFIEADVQRRTLTRRAAVPSPSWSVEAVCQYRDPQGHDQVFLIGDEGLAEQWVLRGSEPLLLRRLAVPPQVKHCVTDDTTQRLFVLEEDQGVSAYNANPESMPRRWPVRSVGAKAPKGIAPWPGGVALIDARGKAVPWAEQTGRYVTLRPGAKPPAPPAELPVVLPKAQTDPVSRHGDAADDPAIWVHPTDPSRSLVLGTNKKQGLLVYDLQGRQRQLLEVGRVNNVDVRQRVRLDGRELDIAVATQRDDFTVVVFGIDADGTVRELGRIPTGLKEIYGLCLHQPRAGGLEVFVNDKDGTFQRHRLKSAGDRITSTQVQRFKLASQPEACVADDAAGVLYMGEEKRGVWAMPLADERERPALSLVMEVGVGAGKALVADVEGLALYAPTPGAAAQYLIVSSQGNHSYLVLDAAPPYRLRGAFRIGLNLSAAIDGASETDGLEVAARPLGPEYPRGALVVQDGFKRLPDGPQNFKIVDWRDVARLLNLP